MSGKKQEKVNVRPGVAMWALFPSMNYKSWVALGEMVDNSIQSYLTHRVALEKLHGPKFKLIIDIDIDKSGDGSITVSDNAAGILEKDVERAFTPAIPPSDKSMISQHGIGMKSSSAWFANQFEIRSKALGETVERSVTFDVPKIISENLEELPINVTENCPAESHYTIIRMTNLHQGAPEGRKLGKIRSYIASIYREFLRSGSVSITVGGSELDFQTPEILESPYWPNDRGPSSRSTSKRWKIPIEIELAESWASDTSSGRPKRPPIIRGWFAILKEGSTSKSGAALIWRKKVVIGAGSLAEGDEDSYRPSSVFGASTTFPYQRLIGELDISELQVTTFKDQVDWRTGQEDELQSKLREMLRSGEEPMLRMANNYRSTLKTRSATKQVAQSAKETVAAASVSIDQLTSMPSSDEDQESNNPIVAATVRERVPLPDGFEGSIWFEVSEQTGPINWLEVVSSENGEYVIRVFRDHLFMKSFANLPGADLDPVFRLAIAIGLAEINAQITGILHPRFIRMRVNEHLNSGLASRRQG